MTITSSLQSFKPNGQSGKASERIGALRAILLRDNLSGFLVPRTDSFQNEYVPDDQERLLWLTGFSGSAGLALVLTDQALLFVDGRYGEQARLQCDGQVIRIVDLKDKSFAASVADFVQKDWVIGYDPWLFTPTQLELYRVVLEKIGVRLQAVETNPIDAIWRRDVDERGLTKSYFELELTYAGETAQKKLARVQSAFNQDGLLVSDPHACAWLLNMRGHDVAYTPLALVRAYIPAEGRALIFGDPAKFSEEMRAKLDLVAQILPQEHLLDFLAFKGARQESLLFDGASVPEQLVETFRRAGGLPEVGTDPIALMKACKNSVEIEGARRAHRVDGVAMVKFLHWLDEQIVHRSITEIDAARALEGFRAENKDLRDLSFPSISAAGAHAAIAHYSVDELSNQPITKGLFLIDSGAQYFAGTTDITRTIAISTPNQELRERYTRVLRGHISVARAVFPYGSTGAQLDSLARAPIWELGLDFDHGTGHGVGSYLGVHEGPQRLSKLGHCPLEAGMVVSNEPGIYKKDAYGIRLENLLLVEARDIVGADRRYLGFETLSLAPFDRRLIDVEQLTYQELEWLNHYHENVMNLLEEFLEHNVKEWLARATENL